MTVPRGTLRKPPEIVHWQEMRHWFRNNITPTDIDLMVAATSYMIERRNSFLLFEFKHDGAPYSGGQRQALEALVRTRFTTSDRLYLVRHNATGQDIRPCHITTWHATEGGRNGRRRSGQGAHQLEAHIRTWLDHRDTGDS